MWLLHACHDGPGGGIVDLAADSQDSAADSATTPDSRGPPSPDSSSTDTADTSSHAPAPLPSSATLEPLSTSPTGVATPPTWNANLPKLAGDGAFYYAVHTYYADDAASRYAEVLSRPASGGAWSVLATISYPHQPPGIVIDSAGRLHLVFVCQRPGSDDVTCFPGGAGTQGDTRRFYHLVFEARDAGGRLRADTYGNWDEWSGATNGYLGLGTTPDGITWWSLADSDWRRVVQSWAEGGDTDTLATLDFYPYYLLYPVHAALSQRELLLFAGAFDPAGGNNAAYPSAVAFSGDGARFVPTWSLYPGGSASLAAFPDDALLDEAGATVLAYVDDGACDTLLASALGTEYEMESRLGCLGTYAKLHRDGDALWLLAPAASPDWTVARSLDGGTTWESTSVSLDGLDPGDVSLAGFTLLRPDTSPLAADPAVVRFFASGLAADGLAYRSYFGELRLR
jgi:hypothetical protein